MWNPFRRLHEKLDRLLVNQERLMTQISDLVSEMNDETNQIAARLDALIAKVNTPAQPDPNDIAQLQALSARLKTLGADPTNPIPPAPATV